jgi:glucose/arabinose dehydrogenase
MLLAGGVVAVTTSGSAQAATLPAGFQETIAFSGLTNPTVVRFSPDGRIFVAEKRGVIKVFDSLTDTTPTVFADLNVNVYNFWDRGLLGMALAPNFPADPYVYVLYTYDHILGSQAAAPRWGFAWGVLGPVPNASRPD